MLCGIKPDSARRRMQCFCMFVRSDSVVRHLVVLDLDILTNTPDYWLITYVHYCTVHESMWRSGSAPNPAGSLQRPPASRPAVKHTSLHNRLGVLNALKLTCSKLEFQKFSGGQTPEPRYWIRPWTQRAGRWSNAGPVFVSCKWPLF